MNIELRKKIVKFIEPNIQIFHKKRIDSLLNLRLNDVLKRKNPYLFKAKNINIASCLIKSLLDAYLSSQEEGIFGDFLEKLAVYICKIIYQGRKSTAEGIDLELEKRNIQYVVTIKSGPNWGNSQQIQRMKDNFRKAKKILRTNNPNVNIMAVNGCCYGIDEHPDKGDYLKLCGQRFWEFITGEMDFYTEIIEPLGYKAKEKNTKFAKEYDKINNKFTLEFSKEYCDNKGNILWKKLVKYNSGKKTK